MPRWHGESTQRSGCISSPPSCYMDPRLMPHNSSTMVSGVPGLSHHSSLHHPSQHFPHSSTGDYTVLVRSTPSYFPQCLQPCLRLPGPKPDPRHRSVCQSPGFSVAFLQHPPVVNNRKWVFPTRVYSQQQHPQRISAPDSKFPCLQKKCLSQQ
ncbi:hypothetical protein XENOCAPTIV_013236 [Xenoophorus captivus]|uniref:Uncharacterized protein n=1 Tax=Xenoophorus captivus TaxID=1517983 RepID=A0ABV0S0A5_9TELE